MRTNGRKPEAVTSYILGGRVWGCTSEAAAYAAQLLAFAVIFPGVSCMPRHAYLGAPRASLLGYDVNSLVTRGGEDLANEDAVRVTALFCALSCL